MDDEERGPKQAIAIAKCFPHEWNAANLRVFCMNATREVQNVSRLNATRQSCKMFSL